MTTIRRIPTSKIDGNNSNSTDANEIRPYGEIAVYGGDNNKLELLMFDGVRTHVKSKVLNKGTFYGGDADSGDGLNRDTIKLIPDAELHYNNSNYGNDQYVIIDPTEGDPVGHIHIRAGGTINQSTADIFLGGEKNNVRVSDTNDRVTISTDAGEGLRSWIFDNDGDLILPQGGDIKDSEGNSVLGGAPELVTFPGGEVGETLTVTQDANNATPGLEDSATVNFIPTSILEANDWIGIGTNDPATYATITFANGTTNLISGWNTDANGDSGFLAFDTAVTLLGEDVWPFVITSYDYSLTSTPGKGISVEGNVWKFDNVGDLTLPQGGTITEGVVTDNPTIELTPAMPEVATQKLVIKGGMFEEPADYHLHLTTGALNETSIILGTDEHNVRTTIEGKIQITTPGEGNNVWEFGTDGLLTFPDGTETSGQGIWPPVDNGLGITLTRNVELSAVAAANSGEGQLYIDISENDDIIVVDTFWKLNTGTPTAPVLTLVTGAMTTEPGVRRISVSGVTFVEGETYTFRSDSIDAVDWVFMPTGELRTSGLGTISHYPGSTSSLKFEVPAGNNIVLRTDGGDLTFGADGNLTFPDATVQTTAFTGTGAITFTGNEIEGNTFGGTGTIITKTVDNTGNDFSTGSGSIGFLNFGADGTIQNVKAGWTVTFASGVTRTVSQDAWQPLGTYWNISFDSAYNWSAGDVMPVTFSSPDYAAGTDPQVTLTAGTESWTFDNNGTLTLPANGDIVNSTGVSQTAQRVEGSWTVTAGTNTYSFTVPMDGTYVMWVKGNIPNGIITWNATASVSNTNVPAIGSQYAWNYTSGGSPILLTAIPDQIKGTEGGISTDNTYVGTTSNRFDFTIANTSGESQTIYYGYTKI